MRMHHHGVGAAAWCGRLLILALSAAGIASPALASPTAVEDPAAAAAPSVDDDPTSWQTITTTGGRAQVIMGRKEISTSTASSS